MALPLEAHTLSGRTSYMTHINLLVTCTLVQYGCAVRECFSLAIRRSHTCLVGRGTPTRDFSLDDCTFLDPRCTFSLLFDVPAPHCLRNFYTLQVEFLKSTQLSTRHVNLFSSHASALAIVFIYIGE